MLPIAEQISIIEQLCDKAAAGDGAALNKAVALWELCARDECSPADVLRMEAIFTALGVAPATYIDL